MQGETNLNFVFHILRQLDSSVLSISSIKRLHLPEIKTSIQVVFVHLSYGYYVHVISVTPIFLALYVEWNSFLYKLDLEDVY